MNLAYPLSLAVFVSLAATGAAAQSDQHSSHHPAASAPAGKARPTMGPQSAAMQSQMKAMQAMQSMHEKMMAAKTPEERNALMAEHTKLMHEGMTMMQSMQAEGMKMDPAARQRMMEMRVDMMQSMMQMMMDGMPAAPAK